MKKSVRRWLQTSPRMRVPLLVLFGFIWLAGWTFGQSASGDGGSIRGIVVNSVTQTPIDHALVSSPDNRMATLTNSEGRFEFTIAKESDSEGAFDSNAASGGQSGVLRRSYSFVARKPGYLSDPNRQGNNVQINSSKDVTLSLIPEAVIAGTVALPTAEAPDSITLQLFRRQVQDGRARWVLAGGARSRSDGQFRFADLSAGTYKLLTAELLDTDPIYFDPVVSGLRSDPFAEGARGPLFGYPPVYYQSALDFETASPIQLSAGQTQIVNLSLVKQTYYRVKVPVIVPGADDSGGLSVEVYAGHKGPGFSLGYNQLHHAVAGMLPNGTYTIEVTSFRANGLTGMQTITVKGAPVEGPGIVLAPNGLIPINVKEEFTSADHTGTYTFSRNGKTSVLNGPRRYLHVTLEPADDYGTGRTVSLRDPTGPQDEALFIEGAPAGKYWVQVLSSSGYPASIRSGNLDLQHQPLVVGVGGAASPIEITMRDDTGEISGTVQGVTPPPPGSASGTRGGSQSRPHVYCIPLADSPGNFTDIWVHSDGSFESQGLAPGAYRVVAFDHPQAEIEYRNPEALQAFDAKGPVIRVTPGQKESVTVPLMTTGIGSSEPGDETSNETSSGPSSQE